MKVDPAQAAEECPGSYAADEGWQRLHRWTLDTSDGIARCVKCAVRARPAPDMPQERRKPA